MSGKIDFKKRDKKYYVPPAKPEIIDIPEMNFLMVDGAGDPNGAEFQNVIAALYAMSYTIKMSPKAGKNFTGYYDYGVAPLEGLWDGGDAREDWTWTAMIRQPEFVTEEVFAWALEKVTTKKPEVDFKGVYLKKLVEGKCVQMMHVGPFATENESFAKMDAFRKSNGIELLGKTHHHEIYLSDFRKVAAEKLNTVLRQQVQ
jgi:hypothetical protein